MMVPFKVESTPQGAQIAVNSLSVGATPTEIQLQCSKRWVGLFVAPGGWAYDKAIYEVTAYPLRQHPSISQTKQVNACQVDNPPGYLYFNLVIDPITPHQRIERDVNLKPTIPSPSAHPTPPTNIASLSTAEEISLVKIGGVYEIPVEVNGVLTLHFILDSGASEVNIPADVVFTLVRTGTIKDTDFLPGKTYVLADGSELRSPRFTIRSLKIGTRHITNVPASVGTLTSSLLLGQSLLERLGTWGINSQRKVLIVNPRSSQIQ